MKNITLLFALLLQVFSIKVLAHEGAHSTPNSTIQFIENKGQWIHPFLYKGISPNADIYLEKDGIKILVGSPENNTIYKNYKDGKLDGAPTLSYHSYKIKWLGANENIVTEAGKKWPHTANYFLGNESSRWKTNVASFGNITYKNAYPGTDIYFYTEQSNLKYDIILQPNADLKKIKFQYDGVNNITIEKGNLVLNTSVGQIIEQKPYAYQYINGEKKEIVCLYELNNNILSFKTPKGYDQSMPLIIDPQMIFASLTGSTADNWGFTATYDKQGNLYAGGIVRATGYPIVTGAIQATYGGGSTVPNFGIDCDISISKFNAAGNQLLYSTYIGGSGNEMPHSLVVDHNNNLIIAGKSSSTNYPTVSTSYDTSHNGNFDIILTKLNAAGNALIGSTFIGGSNDDGVNISGNFNTHTSLKHNYGDDARSEVIVDSVGNIYLASNTRSINFPVSTNAMKSTIGGDQDGVFLKFNPTLSTLMYGTLLGGTSTDGAYSIALDQTQTKIYITGGTSSTDFHSSSTTGAYQSSNAGGIDGFIMRFTNYGNYPLIRTTYIGTSSYDQIYGVQIDHKNSVYVMGQTTSNSFPVFPAGVYQNAGSHQFVMKLDSSLTNGIFSTVYGSGPVSNVNISPVAFLVDTCENIYISGWGGLSAGLPTTIANMPITTNTALQANTDGADFYFIVLKKDVQGLLYGSYFGSPGIQEHVDGGTSRFDPNGVVYQALCASCGPTSAYPATPGAYATSENSGNCNLGVVKIAFNLGSVSTNAQAAPSVTGCAPFTVNFLDNSFNATSWNWNFGDGNSSNAQTPTHTFTNPGVYNVRLIGSNPDACRVLDTSYVTITVTNESITPEFTYTIIDSCENLRVSFTNTSTGINGGPTNGATFQWDFGNGNTFAGANPPVQNYPQPGGTFQIKLKMSMPNACNSPDSVIHSVTFNPLFVTANPLPTQDVCNNTTVQFSDLSVNATNYNWNFGDGNTSTANAPSHSYTTPGTYTVTLIVNNPAACNKSDTVTTTINVRPSPVANFNITPLVPERNTPTTFTNTSTGAVSYHWDFGDGSSSAVEHPVHSFNRSGTYQVCLTAINQYNCKDTICRPTDALVQALADVPTGFSPNGDGNNDLFRVRGYGIKTMNLKVFNRWGELVFESTDQDKGWDGTYKGVLQEADAYAYLLIVDFVDGRSIKKQGNVTLIR